MLQSQVPASEHVNDFMLTRCIADASTRSAFTQILAHQLGHVLCTCLQHSQALLSADHSLQPAANMGYICCRGHTGKASAEHVKAGGNAWDTCKPLHKWFKHLHRVLLMDDDAYKVMLLVYQMCYMPSSTLHVHVDRNSIYFWL